MSVDPRFYLPQLNQQNRVDMSEGPSFSDTLGASFGYQYDPMAEYLSNVYKYGTELDKNYNATEDLGDYELYKSDLVNARNSNHMRDMKRAIDENITRRDVLSQSSFWSQMGAGIFDPVNLMAIPFGGPAIGLGRSFARGAAGVGLTQVGLEAARAPFDPLNTVSESALNVASASVIGGMFGAAVSVPLNRRAAAFSKANAQAEFEIGRAESLQTLNSMSPEELDVARAQPTRSQFESQSTLELDVQRKKMEEENFGREKLLNDEQALADFLARVGPEDEASTLSSLQQNYEGTKVQLVQTKRELAIRNLDPEGFGGISDPFAVVSRGPFVVTNPLNRILGSKVFSDMQKKAATMLVSDSGTLQRLHTIGKTIGASVFQKARIMDGEWVVAHRSMIDFWGEEIKTNVKQRMGVDTTKLGVDLENTVNKLRGKQGESRVSYEDWLTELNRKRTLGLLDTMSESESKASKVMDEFFDRWRNRLEETGQIGTAKNLKMNIEKLKLQVADAQAKLDSFKTAQPKTEKAGRKLARAIDAYEAKLSRKTTELNSSESSLASLADAKLLPANEDIFLPRYWNKAAIRANREKIHSILTSWYTENPSGYAQDKSGKWVKVDFDPSPEAVAKRVDDSIKTILGEIEDQADTFGTGKSKHLRHRAIDIPNKLVWDFIVQNPLSIMKAYTHKTAGRYQFHNTFGKSVDDVMEDNIQDMIDRGLGDKEINEWRKDFLHSYDRVVGSVMKRNPEDWDYRAAYIMKEAAQLNYLGSAGISSIPDFARVIMEHELGDIVKTFDALLTDSRVKLSSEEAQLVGEALEMLQGNAHLRLVDDITNNPLDSSKYDRVKNAFYIANLLSPITQFAKTLDSLVRSHSIISMSIRVAKGEGSELDVTYLARYGIDKDRAIEISRAPYEKTAKGFYISNLKDWSNTYQFPKTDVDIVYGNTGKYAGDRYKKAFYDPDTNKVFFDSNAIKEDFINKPWTKPRVEGVKPLPENAFETAQDYANFVLMHEIMHTKFRPADLKLGLRKGVAYDKANPKHKAAYENKINELAMKEHTAQPKISDDTVEAYKTALSSGILNTIMMGTPADKPIITDGVVYVPMRVAQMFGMVEDEVFKGYSRLESGLLGLPFQFYSYSLAAVNKVAGSAVQGQMKNRSLGMLASIGLGYMTVMYKTPDFAWDEMEWRDRFTRAFDSSGILPLYSDLMYTGIQTSLALGGPNITGGFVNPKFPQQPSVVDALTGIGGAGPSIVADYGKGIVDFMSGNYGEGTKQVARSLPFARMWFWKDEMNALTRAIAGSRF